MRSENPRRGVRKLSATGDLIAALVAGGMNAAEAAGLVARAAVEMTGALTRKKEPTAAAVRMNEYRNRREAMGMPRVFRAGDFKPMLIARDGERCIYCESSGPLVIDHIHPTFLGGDDDHGNLGLACKECNGRKAGRALSETGMQIVVPTALHSHSDYLSRTRTNNREHSSTDLCSPNPRTITNNHEQSKTDNSSRLFVDAANNHEQVHLPSLSKEEKKEVIKKEKRESRANQLPDDWTPDAKFWDEAISILGSEDRASHELRKFKLHALDKGRLAKNWNAAWVKWALQAIEYGNRNGQSVSNHRTDPATGRATAREARHVSTMGSAALRYLEEGKSAGQVREATGRSGITEAFDLGGVAKNAH